MKLSNIKNLGKFEHSETLKIVNIKKGTNAQRGTDHYFYLYRGKRVFLTDQEYFNKWKKFM